MPPKQLQVTFNVLLSSFGRKLAAIGLLPLLALMSFSGCIGYFFGLVASTTNLSVSSSSNIIKAVVGGEQLGQGGCPPSSLMNGNGVPTFKGRGELGLIVQSEGFTVGVELGVQHGFFASEMLTHWTNCTEYHLVDLWGHQENYHDFANVDQDTQDTIYTNAMTHLSAWKDKTHVCRNYTTICVEKYDDGYFDFIYVDARHDFKGVYADIEAYWPKLRVGGIMAGHDYVTQDDGPEQGGQDWTTNFDGTKDETRTVVKGAVDAFAASVCRQVTVSYREDSWNSWAMRK